MLSLSVTPAMPLSRPELEERELTRGAGPRTTLPSLLYCEPWHGHLNLFSVCAHISMSVHMGFLLPGHKRLAKKQECSTADNDKASADFCEARATSRQSLHLLIVTKPDTIA